MSTTPKLDAAIAYHSNWPTQADEIQAEAFRELREHLQRIPAPQATRYPSEAETRLIELVDAMREELFAAHEEAALMFDSKIAAIKRDLGLV